MPPLSSFIPFVRMRERLLRSAADSDTTYFYDVLAATELVLKVTVAGLVAAIRRDPAGHQYRLESALVRADGIGEWVRVLEEVLTGPASEYLATAAREAQRQLTGTVVAPDWRRTALDKVEQAADCISPGRPGFRRAQLRQFFHTFAWIRNKTRGHGAPDLDETSRMAAPLAECASALMDQLIVPTWPWAVVRRGVTGRFRVTPMGNGLAPSLEEMRQRTDMALDDGVYVGLDSPLRVRLVVGDVDLADFFLANGSFSSDAYETLSYASGERRSVPSAPYLKPPAPLPPSETRGSRAVAVRHNVLTNMPNRPAGYVSRQALETEVTTLILDDRRPIVTLGGRGGIGKTSLALQVLDDVARSDRFGTVWWFSARDIDLLPSGPKQVRPDVVTLDDIARDFATLVSDEPGSSRRIALGQAKETFGQWLSGVTAAGPSLFVFDNFETVADPGDAYRWLDGCIRLPNKVLITTRVRDFKGDYPVEVGGMTESEFRALVHGVARQLGIEGIVGDEYIDLLYADSDGHPYVAKILLGEVARTGRPASAERIMAGHEEILTALFERTFALSLTPGAQRAFLTLSAWRSVVAELALKAAMLRATGDRIDVTAAINELVRSSMVDSVDGPDGERFLSVPLAAQLFGRSKLRVSAEKASIESDVLILRAFGAAQESDVLKGLRPRTEALAKAAEADFENMKPILEYVAIHYPAMWMNVANAHHNRSDTDAEQEAVARYVEALPLDPYGWRRLADLAAARGDAMAEMNALVQLADLPTTPYREISDASNRFNYLSAKQRLASDGPAEDVLIARLRSIMESRVAEADATDLSRLGWLCLHQADVISAQEYARRGLTLDPGNRHCSALLSRT
jgi:hypothetical protein